MLALTEKVKISDVKDLLGVADRVLPDIIGGVRR